MIAKIFRLLKTHLWLVLYKNMRRFPGLGISVGVNLMVSGRFEYGHAVGLGLNSIVTIPEHGLLRLGNKCYIGRYVELGPDNKIEIGNHTSINDRCVLIGDVTIGDYCLFGPNVYVSSGRHYFDLNPSWLIKDQDQYVRDNVDLASKHSQVVIIEDDCWIGMNVAVMPGVMIGKGAVIGANSVVTKDVPPYTVVAGVPAIEIKKRLNFLPPRKIYYANEVDWPYFYSGFLIKREDIVLSNLQDGIVTRDKFSISLNTSGASKLCIVAKCVESYSCSLVYEEQSKPVSKDYRTIEFDIRHKELQRQLMLRCSVQTTLWIKEAWVQ
jgi:acetyltransferase-like isoleucine patch superfamily enzyme